MRWEVIGADRETGKDRRVVLDANDEAQAVRRAGRAGILVSGLKPLDSLPAVQSSQRVIAEPVPREPSPVLAPLPANLLACPACARTISIAAAACPQCGHPMREQAPAPAPAPVVMQQPAPIYIQNTASATAVAYGGRRYGCGTVILLIIVAALVWYAWTLVMGFSDVVDTASP